ncbi:hypothetical protein LB505_013735 [Fusarium chuoi]|nr:hypothetical protein LB505_013735 [Fusarium chuoi]
MRFFQLAFASLASVVAATSSFDTWAHGRVALQDVSIHFRYAGSGPPLLLVHGNPQHSLTWQFIGPILAQNYTVIAPDNRGAAFHLMGTTPLLHRQKISKACWIS